MRELERQYADKTPEVMRTVADLRSRLAHARRRGDTIGLVPTMGALHRGHRSLVERARKECDLVVVSVFVNPSQFGEGEDFDAYPRDEQRDLELAGAAGADLVFAPQASEIYPAGFSTTVEVSGPTSVLCGSPESRGSGHFRGVTTVVAILLNACQPNRAYFGQKDFQQTVVVRRMVSDLKLPTEIVVCPTVRENDGLALSSRNAYLTAAEREQASAIKRALDAAAGSTPLPADMRAAALAVLAASGITAEYVEVLDADDLSPVEDAGEQPTVVAIAAPVGKARLIDNLVIEQPNTAATAVAARAATAGAAVA